MLKNAILIRIFKINKSKILSKNALKIYNHFNKKDVAF